MSANKRKHLNIRSDEAYEIAHGLARKLSRSTTEVVVTALRQLDGRRTMPSTKVTPEEAEANYRVIMEGARKANAEHPVSFTSQGIDDFYDEFGLPG